MLDAVNSTIVELAGQPWAYLAVFALAALDALVPPLPSDSVIVALAAVGDEVNLWLLGILGAVGAVIGDSMLFAIGRRIGTDRFAWQRNPRTARGIARARRQIGRRGGSLILTARHVPVGRVAVMLVAGAAGMSWRRFLTFSVIACTAWSAWAIAIGTLVGEILGDKPLLAALVGIVVAVSFGTVIDRLVSRRHAAEADQSAQSPAGASLTRVGGE